MIKTTLLTLSTAAIMICAAGASAMDFGKITDAVKSTAGQVANDAANKGVITNPVDPALITQNLLSTIITNPDFSTLIVALKAAGLTDILGEKNPVTLFAPTNDAFAALPDGTLSKLLDPANQDMLMGILKAHIVPGNVGAADIAEGSSTLTTLAGNALGLVKSPSGVSIGDAHVIRPDIATSNGMIHVIDKVIMPDA